MATSLPRRRFIQGSAVAAALAAAAACGSKDKGSSSSGSAASSGTFEGTGPITWVQGKDNSG
ncbi:ABC superfamily ATP binding cassette transporter substrate-binding protein, partial [human gut metagenome]